MQLGLGLSQVVVACIADVAELRRLGCDARLIKRAYHCSSGSDAFYALSLRAMYLTLSSRHEPSCPWHIGKDFIQKISNAHGVSLCGSRCH